MKLEVVVVPLAYVDRPKAFYTGPNWPDWYARYMADEQTGSTAAA
jgi:hypothetical protein